MTGRLVVRAEWDEEARVWVASSEDVPGLVSEAETVEVLIERVMAVIPELLAANGMVWDEATPVHIMADRLEKLTAVG
jgi:predicted RNase H-like HicB family nuclease